MISIQKDFRVYLNLRKKDIRVRIWLIGKEVPNIQGFCFGALHNNKHSGSNGNVSIQSVTLSCPLVPGVTTLPLLKTLCTSHSVPNYEVVENISFGFVVSVRVVDFNQLVILLPTFVTYQNLNPGLSLSE